MDRSRYSRMLSCSAARQARRLQTGMHLIYLYFRGILLLYLYTTDYCQGNNERHDDDDDE